MAALLRFTKLFSKLAVLLIILFVILTYRNSPLKRHRIGNLHLWKNLFERKLSNVKYVLVWSQEDIDLNVLKTGHEVFTENKCIHSNCFVTRDRNMFENDYRNFDAIVMSAKFISNNSLDIPKKRFPNQTYVFASSESADYYPVCNETFDDYFNVTWSYKLNSDVPWPYFNVLDTNGKKIAPEPTVKWLTDMQPVPATVVKKLTDSKKFTVAWFASNCQTNSNRESFVLRLKIALKKYGYEIDIVGNCGTRECPVSEEEQCLRILENFYFYLAFENAICEDYVTEKVLRAMLHYVVPVVFGGADYSRFLPPHSYINGFKLGPKGTAAMMASLIHNQTAYFEYFRWRNHYSFNAHTDSVCDLCKMLNTPEIRVHNKFREWWNPKYNETCNTVSRHVFFNGP